MLPFCVFENAEYTNLEYSYDQIRTSYDKSVPVLEILKNESLYNRSDKEFQYTLNVFNLLSNPSTASNYLKNTDVINLEELIDGNTIKPAGLDRKPGDTIYNKIEKWAQDNGSASVCPRWASF